MLIRLLGTHVVVGHRIGIMRDEGIFLISAGKKSHIANLLYSLALQLVKSSWSGRTHIAVQLMLAASYCLTLRQMLRWWGQSVYHCTRPLHLPAKV